MSSLLLAMSQLATTNYEISRNNFESTVLMNYSLDVSKHLGELTTDPDQDLTCDAVISLQEIDQNNTLRKSLLDGLAIALTGKKDNFQKLLDSEAKAAGDAFGTS